MRLIAVYQSRGGGAVSRPLLYVAGPYSSDPVIGTRLALVTAMAIYERTEFVPVVPHLTFFWHLVTPQPYDVWLDIDLTVLERCHAITRLPGESAGADREVEHAIKIGLPLLEFSGF